MKRTFSVASLAIVLAAVVFAFQSSPLLSTVEPDTGKEGDTVSAKGQSLSKKAVGELYLTDGKRDVKVVILDQLEEEIKFKVPKINAGRYRLMVLTTNKSHYIEQPVVFTVGE